MRAIVIRQFGGPEVLTLVERPVPEPRPGHVVIEVKAFGVNQAEVYFRKGAWGEVAEISGIECAGRGMPIRTAVSHRARRWSPSSAAWAAAPTAAMPNSCGCRRAMSRL